jgi:hypothetical protein
LLKRPAVLPNAFLTPIALAFAVGSLRLQHGGFVALAIPNAVLIEANIPGRFPSGLSGKSPALLSLHLKEIRHF